MLWGWQCSGGINVVGALAKKSRVWARYAISIIRRNPQNSIGYR